MLIILTTLLWTLLLPRCEAEYVTYRHTEPQFEVEYTMFYGRGVDFVAMTVQCAHQDESGHSVSMELRDYFSLDGPVKSFDFPRNSVSVVDRDRLRRFRGDINVACGKRLQSRDLENMFVREHDLDSTLLSEKAVFHEVRRY
ncbi:hypothetical protein FOZ60_006198 [Perkinsus olseni]|uniref:Uncharacterized protein n=1 Tax=Perkinsus olseni TaxID=32597 RepID=A0A7J6NPL9_PEROL|nr:hypothetical protein FOZ60_006198 [Perkinsus olseni]